MTTQIEFDFDALVAAHDEAQRTDSTEPPAPPRLVESSGGTTAPLLLRPEEAAAVLSVGRSTLYELLAAGAVESVLIGKSRRVPVAALADYVAGLRAMQGRWTHAHARRAAREAGRPQRVKHPVTPLRPVGDPQPTTAEEQDR
ncbi:MAG TPA: helix-turn-helix domain-containing protein [Acidimicrobiales bacterium]|nr:helix-turn-helix domain-containing protein [Acidimicrobiales bacterium]